MCKMNSLLTRCVATNGLLLPQKLEELKEVGCDSTHHHHKRRGCRCGLTKSTITLTTEARLCGVKKRLKVLSKNQLVGLRAAADSGMVVKVNSVYIPGINSDHLVKLQKTVSKLGRLCSQHYAADSSRQICTHTRAFQCSKSKRSDTPAKGILFQFP